jgi:uncharacterized protein YbbC (DUF1343 family)
MSGAPRCFALAAALLALVPGARRAEAAPGSTRIEIPQHVLLGIDVLELEGFAPLRGKRIALLTHRAGVDGRGVSTIDILRREPGLKLVALFATENGLSGTTTSGKPYPDQIDPRTGLMVFSLYNGRTHQPTAAQLRGIDALVIDLQDIGSRSYTFTGAMKQAMEGCFINHVDVIVLDRPNPLGGLKVDGPLPDPQWVGPNLVNEFPVPYVHGLTIGELARFAKGQPGVLRVPEAVRLAGKLTVIPMRNWHRNMRWPETGLAWVMTSPYIPDFSAVEGYPMTGLGTFMADNNVGGFSHGIGKHADGSPQYPFRGIADKYVKPDTLEHDLNALGLPGLRFQKVSVPGVKSAQPASGIFIQIIDWDAWRPTELNFYMMQLDCRFSPRNPFAVAPRAVAESFLRHMGSTAFFNDLKAHGDRVDVAAYLRQWEAEDHAFQQLSRKYWLYN